MSMKNNFLSYSPAKPGRLRYLTISFILWFVLFPFVEKTSFKLSDSSFQQLQNDKIPDEVLEGLRQLKDREFAGKDELLAAVEKHIGKERTDQYAKLILKRALKYGGIELIILNILTSAIFAFGIYAVSYKRKTVIIGLVLGLPWFILELDRSIDHPPVIPVVDSDSPFQRVSHPFYGFYRNRHSFVRTHSITSG